MRKEQGSGDCTVYIFHDTCRQPLAPATLQRINMRKTGQFNSQNIQTTTIVLLAVAS